MHAKVLSSTDLSRNAGPHRLDKTIDIKRSEVIRELYRSLHDDGYWREFRAVEITAKAAVIEVCYLQNGNSVYVDWEAFITDTVHYCGNKTGGPVRLHAHFRSKHGTSPNLSFWSLLRWHGLAKSSHPRDRIYTLAALANDTRGFPNDHSRPPLEVWKDTLRWINPDTLDLVSVASHCKSVLDIRDKVDLAPELESSLRGNKLTREGTTRTRFTAPLSLTILGRVIMVGPEVGDVVRSPSVADRWASTILVDSADAAAAGHLRLENDALLRRLLDTAASSRRPVRYAVSLPRPFRSPCDGSFLVEPSASSPIPPSPAMGAPEKEGCRLYQLATTHNPEGRRYHLGVTVDAVQAGDLICLIPEMLRVVLVREVHEEKRNAFRILGTSMLAQGYLPAEQRATMRIARDLVLQVPLETAYLLLTTSGPGLREVLAHPVWRWDRESADGLAGMKNTHNTGCGIGVSTTTSTTPRSITALRAELPGSGVPLDFLEERNYSHTGAQVEDAPRFYT